jgi:hypothetical protein
MLNWLAPEPKVTVPAWLEPHEKENVAKAHAATLNRRDRVVRRQKNDIRLISTISTKNARRRPCMNTTGK